MAFSTGAPLLDALVLSIVSQESTYGYKITHDVRSVMDVSESTLYPVLRRLQKDGCLVTYDQEFGGRNRRYYRLTESGVQQLEAYRAEWRQYEENIDNVLFGGICNE
ncbi:MAG: PadR family transcriptional regulator [Oscillospiraceae bacterium]